MIGNASREKRPADFWEGRWTTWRARMKRAARTGEAEGLAVASIALIGLVGVIAVAIAAATMLAFIAVAFTITATAGLVSMVYGIICRWFGWAVFALMVAAIYAFAFKPLLNQIGW